MEQFPTLLIFIVDYSVLCGRSVNNLEFENYGFLSILCIALALSYCRLHLNTDLRNSDNGEFFLCALDVRWR